MFEDKTFPHNNDAFYWPDASEEYRYPSDLTNTHWKRASEVFADKTLFGTGIRP